MPLGEENGTKLPSGLTAFAAGVCQLSFLSSWGSASLGHKSARLHVFFLFLRHRHLASPELTRRTYLYREPCVSARRIVLQCPLWVISFHQRATRRRPLCTRKQTSTVSALRSAMCHKQTSSASTGVSAPEDMSKAREPPRNGRRESRDTRRNFADCSTARDAETSRSSLRAYAECHRKVPMPKAC